MDGPEIDCRAELLMRNAAAVFWENHFHTPFPCTDRRPSLPTIPEKVIDSTIVTEDSGSPMPALVASPKFRLDLKNPKGTWQKAQVGAPSKNIASDTRRKEEEAASKRRDEKIHEIRKGSMMPASEESLPLKAPPHIRPQSRASLEPQHNEAHRDTHRVSIPSSHSTFDSMKHKRAQSRLERQNHLPTIPKCQSDDEVTQQRAVDAIHRADIIHARRAGSLDEYDEAKYGHALCLGESGSGKSDASGLRGSSSRSNSFKGSRPTSRSNSFRGSRSSTPLSSRFANTEPADVVSLQEIIDKSPALQEAIAANMLLPSFARNTISSLIQSTRAADVTMHSSVITKERTQQGGFKKS